jgi:hypothetical protein
MFLEVEGAGQVGAGGSSRGEVVLPSRKLLNEAKTKFGANKGPPMATWQSSRAIREGEDMMKKAMLRKEEKLQGEGALYLMED